MAAGDVLQTHHQHGGDYVEQMEFALPSDVQEGSTLVMWIATEHDTVGGGSGVTAVSDSLGNTWTRVTGDSGGSRWGELWYTVNPRPGETTITVDFVDFTDNVVLLREFEGVFWFDPLLTHSITGQDSFIETHTSGATAATSGDVLLVGGITIGTDGATFDWPVGWSTVDQDGFDEFTGTSFGSLTTSDSGPHSLSIGTPGNFVQSITGLYAFRLDTAALQISVDGMDGVSAELTNIHYAIFREPLPGAWGEPAKTGSDLTIASDGSFTIDVSGLSLEENEIVYIYVTDTDGSVGEMNHHGGPIAVEPVP